MSDLLFDLTLSDEQRMTRESVSRFAETELAALAREADDNNATPEGFFDKTLELGLGLMPIPEALGGAGVDRSPVSNALTAEDLSRGDMSLALGSLTPLGFINTVIDQGTDAQKEKYLPSFCGEQFEAATVAFMEPRATFDPSELQTSARKDGNEYVINGSKTMVALGVDAQLILVVAELEGTGPAAFIVEGNPEGLERSAQENMGLRGVQMADLSFNDVRLPESALLGDGGFDLQRYVDLSRIGICALAVGTCQAVLDYVVEYCNERVAFGEPISNRQSVAFMIADMATELDAMRLMTWRAAAQAEQGSDFHQQAYLAKTFCGEHAMKIGTDGVQLLGGHGFTKEHPAELWYRNLRAIAILEGAVSV